MTQTKLTAVAAAFAAIWLTACTPATETSVTAAESAATEQAESAQTEAQKINALVAEYFDENMARNPLYATFVGRHENNDKFIPPITDAFLAGQKAFHERYLTKAKAIDASQLEGQDWLTHRIFVLDRENSLRGFAFPEQYLPISQQGGAHTYFAIMGSGQSAQPFNTVEDYENFIKRADGFAEYMDSVIDAMRKGMGEGVVLPKPIVEKLIPQLTTHVVESPEDSVFYGPVSALADKDDFSDEQKADLTARYRTMITEVIAPAYKRVADFVSDEYLANARETVGMSGLPNGKAWYEYEIAGHTTLEFNAEEIHEFGKQEVARILSEMKGVKEAVGFEGDLQAFFTFLREDDQFYFDSPEAVIEGYETIKAKIDERVPQLFEVFPKRITS